ncbi:hypothetical protein [Brachybacterium sp. GPGPB12]|uniref:hypothetical protein n=1 Tax=Brachybacterium sp. GPGPB12 TaxID=3023517 RepID=UPI0031342E9C
MSRSNAYARVEALTDSGVITGYSAQIDPVKAGLGVCTLVFVTVHPQLVAGVPRRDLGDPGRGVGEDHHRRARRHAADARSGGR